MRSVLNHLAAYKDLDYCRQTGHFFSFSGTETRTNALQLPGLRVKLIVYDQTLNPGITGRLTSCPRFHVLESYRGQLLPSWTITDFLFSFSFFGGNRTCNRPICSCLEIRNLTTFILSINNPFSLSFTYRIPLATWKWPRLRNPVASTRLRHDVWMTSLPVIPVLWLRTGKEEM